MDLGGLGEKAMRHVVRRGIYPIGQRYSHGTDMQWTCVVCPWHEVCLEAIIYDSRSISPCGLMDGYAIGRLL
jgi:hypothetical protein